MAFSLRNLSDEILIDQTQQLAATERKIYSEILEALTEIERRKLHLSRGFSSMFEFCTKHLHYSAGSAQRRIDSMLLLKSLPAENKTEMKEKLQSGVINLSHLSQVSKLIRHRAEPMSVQEKLEVIHKIENTTQAECEKRLVAMGGPSKIQRESFRRVSASESRLAINLDDESLDLLNEVVQLTARQNPWASKEKAIKIALKIAVEKLRKKKSGQATRLTSNNTELQSASDPRCESTAATAVKILPSRYIPAQIRKEVWRRDGGSCCYFDEFSQKKCGSRFAIEIDHIHPFAKGGSHSTENLRLCCASHNRHKAANTMSQDPLKLYGPVTAQF